MVHLKCLRVLFGCFFYTTSTYGSDISASAYFGVFPSVLAKPSYNLNNVVIPSELMHSISHISGVQQMQDLFGNWLNGGHVESLFPEISLGGALQKTPVHLYETAQSLNPIEISASSGRPIPASSFLNQIYSQLYKYKNMNDEHSFSDGAFQSLLPVFNEKLIAVNQMGRSNDHQQQTAYFSMSKQPTSDNPSISEGDLQIAYAEQVENVNQVGMNSENKKPPFSLFDFADIRLLSPFRSNSYDENLNNPFLNSASQSAHFDSATVHHSGFAMSAYDYENLENVYSNFNAYVNNPFRFPDVGIAVPKDLIKTIKNFVTKGNMNLSQEMIQAILKKVDAGKLKLPKSTVSEMRQAEKSGKLQLPKNAVSEILKELERGEIIITPKKMKKILSNYGS